MFIKKIVIEGVEGDVEIRRTECGAIVTANEVDAEINRDMSREDRYAVAWNAAKVICGELRNGKPNATNSMIHDVLDQIDRVAGC